MPNPGGWLVHLQVQDHRSIWYLLVAVSHVFDSLLSGLTINTRSAHAGAQLSDGVHGVSLLFLFFACSFNIDFPFRH